MKIKIGILLCFLCSSSIFAQICAYKIGYNVRENGKFFASNNSFAGGFNNPQFNNIDLNNDGMEDMLVFDRNDNILKFFSSVPILPPVIPTFYQQQDMVNTYHDVFPKLLDYVILKDYNNDAKPDIFTATPNFTGIRVFKNTSVGANIAFTPFKNVVFSLQPAIGYFPIQISNTDYPAIEDADNDGDIDILTFNANGSLVEFHKNKSMELYGIPDSLVFEMVSPCWGNFAENFFDNTVVLSSCIAAKNGNSENGAHSGSTLLVLNTDGDGDKDLILGDISHNNLVQLTNGGTNASPNVTGFDYAYPPNTLAANVELFPAMFYVDATHDGVKDLIVSPNSRNNSNNYESAWLYKNNGSNNSPDFQFVQKDFLQSTMLDFGWAAYPTVFDENGDGKPDILVGNYGYFGQNGNQYVSKLALLRNTASNPNSPEFELVTRDFLNLSALNKINLHPTTADIDADGDLDMFLGDNDGKIYFYRNDVALGMANYVLQTQNYFNIDVGQAAAPQFFDVDRDGALDLIVGERTGKIQFFKNTGTPTNAIFSATPTSPFWGGIDVLVPCCTGFAAPHLVDSSGVLSLFVGAENGKMYEYTNINTTANAIFTLKDSLDLHSSRIAPIFFDLDQNGKKELIWGEQGGGLGVCTRVTLGSSDEPRYRLLVVTQSENQVFWQLKTENKPKKLSLFNAMGQRIMAQNDVQNEGSLSIENLPKGIYFLELETSKEVFFNKFIK